MHTPACRSICLCHNPDRLCIAEREVLDDTSIMTNNLGDDYSHFKTPRLRKLYCTSVGKAIGQVIDPDDVKTARVLYQQHVVDKMANEKIETTPLRTQSGLSGFFRRWIHKQTAEVHIQQELLSKAVDKESMGIELQLSRLWWAHVWENRWSDPRWRSLSMRRQLLTDPGNEDEYLQAMLIHREIHPLHILLVTKRLYPDVNSEDAVKLWKMCGSPTSWIPREIDIKPLLEAADRELIARRLAGITKQDKQRANAFFDVIRDGIYTDIWAIILSKQLGYNHIQDPAVIRDFAASLNFTHPLLNWFAVKGINPVNKEEDRVVFWRMMGSPNADEINDAILRVVKLFGEPFDITFPEFENPVEEPMPVNKVELFKRADGNWGIQHNGKFEHIKLGGLPKTSSLYSSEFYDFDSETGTAGISSSVEGEFTTITINRDFTIIDVVNAEKESIPSLIIPVDHPILDLLLVQVSLKQAING